MFVFKLLPVILALQVVWCLTAIEDKFLTNQLKEYFEEESQESDDEAVSNGYKKREAMALSKDDEKLASLFSSSNLTDRANHYWTRKRGREKTAQPERIWDVYYTLYPTRNAFSNLLGAARKKREVINDIFRLGKISKRTKREVESEAETVFAEAEKLENKSKETQKPTEELQKDENKPQEKSQWKKFGRKLNRCCMQESNLPDFNQTLKTAKAQCMNEARKTMKKFNASEDTFDGNGGLYNMFSCDRTNRWKTMVTCSIDCVSQKIGIINSKGVINAEEAKRVINENFAQQAWEHEASDKLVEKCMETVVKSSSRDIDAYGLSCSTKAAEFAYCVWREMFLTCPENKQEKTKPCEKLRSVLTKFDDNKFKN